MLERSTPILRIACVALASILILQLAWLLVRRDPLADIRIPTVGATSPTNASHSASAPPSPGNPTQTGGLPASASQTGSAPTLASNPSAHQAGGAPHQGSGPGHPRGNGAPMIPGRGPAFGLGPGGPGGPGAQALADLPPQIKARVERITQSQILGMVMHPPPMALLGVAGKDVLLRAPSGQTGLIREGEELGGVKLLRVGMNRVLVEVDGRQQELTIFSGLGSETLLPKGKENPQ